MIIAILMIKTILAVALAILLAGAISSGTRFWFAKATVDQIAASLQTLTGSTYKTVSKTLNKNKIGIMDAPVPQAQISSGQLNPRDNPHEWSYISNNKQICWIHKKTYQRICEAKI